MKILAIANQKGGVGKTTSAVTLASAFARMGKRVLLIDLDPHACASIHLRIYPEQQELSIYDLFISPPGRWADIWDKLLLVRGKDQIHVISASPKLSDLDVDLHDRPGKGAILKRSLSRLAGDYDYVVLDCPPHMSVLLVNALVAADLVIIPVQTDFLALHGLKLLFDTINLLNKALKRLVNYRILATMYDRRAGACQRVLALMRQKMETSMFETVIGVDTKFREASAQGKVIYELGGSSRGGTEYEAVAVEIMDLI